MSTSTFVHSSQALEDTIRLPADGTLNDTREQLLLFNITGNPGLAEYYRTFLTLCYDGLRDLSSTHGTIDIHLFSTSMAGFGVKKGHGDKSAQAPFDLEQQIDFIEEALYGECGRLQSHAKREQPLRVVLMGHSVGSYILMEILRRYESRLRTESRVVRSAKIVGGICLFPTVVDIAKSSNGRKFSVRACHDLGRNRILIRMILQYLFAIPHFALIAGWLVKLLIFWLPASQLERLIGLVDGFPPEACRTTAAFIKSHGGVRQAL